MGDAEANPEDLVGGEEWGPLPRKNDFFRLKWRALVNFERYFFSGGGLH